MALAQKQTYRLMEQNGEAEINPHRPSQLIPNKESKNIQWRKKTSSAISVEKIVQQNAKESNKITFLFHA